MNSILYGILSISIYLLVTGLIVKSLSRQDPATERLSNQSNHFLLAWVAAFFHGLSLVDNFWSSEGVNFSLLGTAALVVLIIVLILLTTALSKPVEKLGLVIFPLAALSLALKLIFPPQTHILKDIAPGMEVHILTSILAYSLLNIAAAQALLLALQDRQLHRHRSNRFIQSFPPLQTMESLLFQMIGAGFVLLTISLSTGMIYIEDIFAQHLSHKTVLSISAWIVFSVLLWGKIFHGWRGQTAIRWTLAGFLFLMLAYFGSKMVLEIILKRT